MAMVNIMGGRGTMGLWLQVVAIAMLAVVPMLTWGTMLLLLHNSNNNLKAMGQWGTITRMVMVVLIQCRLHHQQLPHLHHQVALWEEVVEDGVVILINLHG